MDAIKFQEILDNADAFKVSIGDDDYIGLFDNGRIDRNKLPKGWYAYDLREDDNDFTELKNGIIAINHGGIFLTQDKLPLKEGESLCAPDFDYDFDAEDELKIYID